METATAGYGPYVARDPLPARRRRLTEAQRLRVLNEEEARRQPTRARLHREYRARVAWEGLLEDRLAALKDRLPADSYRRLVLLTKGIGGGSFQLPQPARTDLYDDYFDPGPLSGTVRDVEVDFAGNLTNAVTAAQYGDIVLLARYNAGAKTYQGPLVLPANATKIIDSNTPLRSDGQPSYIRVKSDGGYPTDGTRVGASHVDQLGRINAGTLDVTGTCLQTCRLTSGTTNPCHHYRFEGIHFLGKQGAPHSNGLIEIGNTVLQAEGNNLLLGPHHLLFVATLMQGRDDGTSGAWRAIRAIAFRHVGVFDSSMPGIASSEVESHCFGSVHGFRGLHIENTYGEGMTEGLILTGTGETAESAAYDIIFHRCHSKKPPRWNRRVPKHATYRPYAGTVSVSGTAVTGSSTQFVADNPGSPDGFGRLVAGDAFAAVGFRVAQVATTPTVDTAVSLTAAYPAVPGGTNYLTFCNGSLNDSYLTTPSAVNISGVTVTLVTGSWRTGDPVVPGPTIGQYLYFTRDGFPPARKFLITGVTSNTLTLQTGPGDGTNIEDWYVTAYDFVHRGVSKNLFEFKHARRVEISDCLFENVWADGGVEGGGYVCNEVRDTMRVNSTSDVRISWCEFRHCRVGPQVQSNLRLPAPNSAFGMPGVHLIEHCLFTGGLHPGFGNFLSRRMILTNTPWSTWRHCTYLLAPGDKLSTCILTNGQASPTPRWLDNILQYGTFQPGDSGVPAGVVTDPDSPTSSSTTDAALAARLIPQANLDRNVFVGGSVGSTSEMGHAMTPMLRALTLGLDGRLYGNAGIVDLAGVGFVNPTRFEDGDYALQPIFTTDAGACTVTDDVVTITGTNFPISIQRGTPFRVSVDGADKLVSVKTRDSGTQLTLAVAYPGTTGSGLTGVCTFQGSASDGTDPGVDYVQLQRRLAGVEAGDPWYVIMGRLPAALIRGLNSPISDGSPRRTWIVDEFERRAGSVALPNVHLDIDLDESDGWEPADARNTLSVRVGEAQAIAGRASNLRFTGTALVATHWAEARVGATIGSNFAGPTTNTGPWVALNTPGRRDQYFFMYGSGTTFTLFKTNNGVDTTLASVAGTLVPGDLIRLEHNPVGVLTAYKNGGPIVGMTNIVDPTPYVSGAPGLRTSQSSSQTLLGFTTFLAGDFSPDSGGPPPPPPQQPLAVPVDLAVLA